MNIVVKRGLPLSLSGAPEQVIGAGNAVATVGLLASDHPTLRTEPLVGEGDRVEAGAAICRDRNRPDIVFTAPDSGIVTAVLRGPRRRQTDLTIAIRPGEPRRFDIPRAPGRDAARRLLLESGIWPGLLSRPFGRIPDPGSTPDAIFLAAHDTRPFAASPVVVLDNELDAFARGVDLIKALTDGPVFLCQARGADLVREDAQLRCVHVRGPHPVGLVGSHVGRLFPLHGRRCIWQIHFQDVLAIGKLLESGTFHSRRVISLAGAGVMRPRLIRVPQGADLDDIVAGELARGEQCVLSGPPLAGRESRYLGRYHWQVTVLPRRRSPDQRRWWMDPGRALRPRPIVPTAAIENALGPAIPAVPLLRALSVGDAGTAERLGCLSLLEEDMALATYAAGGTEDFGVLLRLVLDTLEATR